jgi:hypothetical protein
MMQLRFAWSGALALVLTAAACGGRVVVDAPALGGSGGSGTGGSNTGGSNTGGTTVAKTCGGKQGFVCDPGEWCQADQPGSCTNYDGAGTCQPIPGGTCPPDCPGVCGCNGLFYCSACAAHQAGADVSSSLSCASPADAGTPPTYSASILPTDGPRYAIIKTEWEQDRCIVIFVVGFPPPGPFTIDVTAGWSVERIFAAPGAATCANLPGTWPTPPDAVDAFIASGSIKQDNTSFPCFVNVAVTGTWQSAPAWVPTSDTLLVDNLPVQGSVCPL